MRFWVSKDFGTVKKGDKGGLIEKESNLEQEGCCWVYWNAKISGNAEIWGNADYLLFYSGEFKRATTVTLSNKKIKCGCFYGGVEDFEKAVKKKYGDTKTEYYLYIYLIKKYFEQ